MSFVKFVVWFIVGLVGTVALQMMFKNPFVLGVIAGFIMGVLGAKD